MQSVTSNAVAKQLQNYSVVSTVLYSGDLSMTSGQTYYLYGAYSYDLFYWAPSLPQGWHYEYVLSAQGTSQGNGFFIVSINNINVSLISTWSGYTFRVVRTSERFKLSDIILEPTYQLAAPGCNLKITTFSSDGNPVEMHCYNICITAFAVKD